MEVGKGGGWGGGDEGVPEGAGGCAVGVEDEEGVGEGES